MNGLEELTDSAETEWLDRWSAGPTEKEGPGLPTEVEEPDARVLTTAAKLS